MGLDMYLEKRTYVKNWDHMGPQELHEVLVKKGGKLRGDIKPDRVSYVVEQVAYWRKANQIHTWFVENVQGSKDDCGSYYVSTEQLLELLDLCRQVLDSLETVEGDVVTSLSIAPGQDEFTVNTKPGQVVAQAGLAAKLLPTSSGFFFGSTDYDEFYLDDVRRTIKQIEPLLNEGGDGSYYYQSSW